MLYIVKGSHGSLGCTIIRIMHNFLQKLFLHACITKFLSLLAYSLYIPYIFAMRVGTYSNFCNFFGKHNKF